MLGEEQKMTTELARLEALKEAGEWQQCALWGEVIAARSESEGSRDVSGNALFICAYARGQLGDLEGAIDAYERAVEVGFSTKGVVFNLANSYRVKGESKKALELYQKILDANPGDGATICNMAFTWEDLGERKEADKYFKLGAEVFCENEDAITNCSFTLLREGRLKEGWDLYERRGEKEKTVRYTPNYKRGMKLTNKSVLIAVEQGYGDVLMFAGLVREIQERAKEVTLLCDERLLPTLKRSLPRIEVTSVIDTKKIQQFDVRMGIASLGAECRYVEIKEFKPVQPYLKASKEKRKEASKKLKELKAGKIVAGIAWKGGGDERNRKRRSIELGLLQPLLEISGIEWINMQYGSVDEEIRALFKETGIKVNSLFDPTEDLEGLTAYVQEVDVVVSVQQTLVHFAGSSGARCEALIPVVPEWRYGISGSSMLWWESVRLHRQEKLGDWNDAIWQIKRELEKMVYEKYGAEAKELAKRVRNNSVEDRT